MKKLTMLLVPAFLAVAGVAQAAPAARNFSCVGELEKSNLNVNVPAHFQRIHIQACAGAGVDNLDVEITISDGKTFTCDKFVAEPFHGTTFALGALKKKPNQGFYYLTYEQPANPAAVFEAEFVYADGAINDPARVRARFGLLCTNGTAIPPVAVE
jgi:hypothetical protein